MSKSRIVNVTFIEPYDSSDYEDSDYIPSQTSETGSSDLSESEYYSSCESSQQSDGTEYTDSSCSLSSSLE